MWAAEASPVNREGSRAMMSSPVGQTLSAIIMLARLDAEQVANQRTGHQLDHDRQR